MGKKLIFAIPLLIPFFIGCANNKAITEMMDTINSEKNELIVLNNEYQKFEDAVNYFMEVHNSDSTTALNKSDCLTYYGNSRLLFSDLSNGMDTNKYITLVDLKDSTNYMVNILDTLLLYCEGKINKENKELFVAKLEELYKKAGDSEDTFLKNAGDLINKYKYDLQVYSTYTTQEAQKKSQFWAQFFGVLAGTLASRVGDGGSTEPSIFSITDTQTGEMTLCNNFAGVITCY